MTGGDSGSIGVVSRRQFTTATALTVLGAAGLLGALPRALGA
ncbi:hypothetical protein [Arthrobacter sp. CAU 1506]|nr:hypothetical protein [Arthrobacter sp. CAU 1506]